MPEARLAQSAERKALNLVVVGSSPTVGALMLPASYVVRVTAQLILRRARNWGLGLRLPCLALFF